MTPFPTVARLAKECGREWPRFQEAARQTSETERKIREAITSRVGDRVLDTDSSLVLFGSFARYEMGIESDCDWTLLINGVVNNRHAANARMIRDSLKLAKLNEPAATGAFGNLCFSHDLVHKIGGGADSNENLTRRILMLLESRPMSLSETDSVVEVRQAVLRSILERYFEEDVHFSPKKKVPRFLLNDLTRYWRTVCVDYAAKHQDQDGAKWALRNAKLRLSRKLLYAKGLAFCFQCHLAHEENDEEVNNGGQLRPVEPFIADAMRFADTPPLEFLAAFIDAFLTNENRRSACESIFGAYDLWLELMGDQEQRIRLKDLSLADATGDAVFQRVRQISKMFANGLKLLFFGRDSDKEEISDLSLEYVGF